MYAILSLTKEGPDRSIVASCLWNNCAIPSILYGAKCNLLTKTSMDELERIQARVGKFILQLSALSTNVTSNIEAGLIPIKIKILDR